MLLTLVYLSQLHNQYLGVQFGVSESTANIFSLLVDILELLPASLLEQKKNPDFEWVLEILTSIVNSR